MFGRGQGGDFGRLGKAGMVFPEPGHGIRVPPEFLAAGKRRPFGVDGERGRAGRIHAEADDPGGGEGCVGPPSRGQSFTDGGFDRDQIVIGILAG